MGQRSDLHEILREIMGNGNVYFQPPSNIQMKYPAIVYERDYSDTQFAGNSPYSHTWRYQLT